MIVSFFIAGAQKSGTTALDHYLRGHPNIQMAREKEVHFFDDESVDWSKPNYTKLHDAFDAPAEGQSLRGEATPIYTYWPQALERIRRYNERAKIIVGLRHPSLRAYSHWRMETKRGNDFLPFNDAIRQAGRRRVAGEPNGAHRIHSYVERGLYAGQVERLLALFPRDQVFFFRTDTLWTDPPSVLGQVQTFLQLEPKLHVERAYIVPEWTWTAQTMRSSDRTYLDEIFADDIRKTADRTGLTLDDWLGGGYLEPIAPD